MATADAICELLAGVLHHDKAMRVQCENRLSDAKGNVPNYGLLLLEIASSAKYPEHLRQSASITLKNFVFERDWNCPDRQKEFPPQIRAAIKSEILNTIVHAPEMCRRQLLITVRCIYVYDKGSGWPDLVPQISALLRSNEPHVMVCALRVTRIIAKNLELPSFAETESMTTDLMPTLLDLFKYVLEMAKKEAPPPLISEMLKLVVKIFWSSTSCRIPDVLCQSEVQSREWLECLFAVLQLPIHPEAMQNPRSDSWKFIKWVANVVRKLMQTLAYPEMVPKDAVPFMKLFESWQERYANVFLEIITSRSKGMPVPDKPFVVGLEILGLCSAKKKLYLPLKERMPTLICDVLLPELRFTAEEEELWNVNPHDYLRRQFDISDVYNVKAVIMHTIETFTIPSKKFHDKTMMGQLLGFLSTLVGHADPRTKYSGLYAIRHLHDTVASHEVSGPHLLSMLSQHVFPETRSNFGFMRAMAVSVLSKFTRQLAAAGEPFTHALSATLDLVFGDNELPVRVYALISLRHYLRRKASISLVEPRLEELVKLCFRLMKELDDEEIVGTLDVIIDRFGNRLASWSCQLCDTLIRHFWDLHNHWTQEAANSSAEDFDNEKFSAFEAMAMAADSTLETISTLVGSVTHHPDVFNELQPVLAPFISRLFEDENHGYLEGALSMFVMLSFHAKPVQKCVWDLFPVMHRVALDGAMDYFNKMMDPIDNLISKDPEMFIRGDYIKLMYELCEAAMDPARDLHEREMMSAPKLIETMLQHCKEVNELLQPYLHRFYDLVLNALRQKQDFSDFFVLLLYHSILNGFWFNARFTLDYLQQRGVVDLFFNTYIEFLSSVRKRLRPYDRKIAALGLTCVLPLASADLSPKLREIVWDCVTTNHTEYIEEENEFDAAVADDSDDLTTTDEDDDDLDGDSDAMSDMSDEAEALQKRGGRGRVKYSGGEVVRGARDEQPFEDDDFFTVVDDVSESVVLRDMLRGTNQPLPPNLDQMCSFDEARLKKRKDWENSVSQKSKEERMQYESKRGGGGGF